MKDTHSLMDGLLQKFMITYYSSVPLCLREISYPPLRLCVSA
jgi:hypothetical protein